MLNPHLFARNKAILCSLLRCQFATTWLLGRLLDYHVLDCKSLKSHVLIQHTSSRQGVRFIINNRFVMPLPYICPAQKLNMTVLINQENVFDRMTFLLPTIVLILFVTIYGPLNGAFRTIVIKTWAPSSVEPSFSANKENRYQIVIPDEDLEPWIYSLSQGQTYEAFANYLRPRLQPLQSDARSLIGDR